MIYLLALIIPLSFLYSPPVEKTGPIYVAKTMQIKVERKTPAYALFQQAQKVVNPEARRPAASVQTAEILTLNEVDPVKIQFPEATQITEMSFSKKELLAQTENELHKLAVHNQDSSLLNRLQTFKNNPFENMKQSVPNSASIQGYFELSDGVGLVNQTVSLRRVREGHTVEVGQVDVKAGMYQIFVGSFDGELVAEIKDENGIIIGEDRKRISGLVRQKNYFQGPQLILGRPSSFALNLRNADGRKILDSEYNAAIFSGNYALKKTTDSYPNVARHSSTLALVESTTGKLARTLSVRTAKDYSETLMFSANWIDGVKEYLSEKIQIQYMSQTGTIIGRILLDGKPVTGAQVVIENQPGIEPYYLDQFFIPQVNQSTTSSNGYFVIPGLQAGSYQIAAFLQNRNLGSQAYFVEPEFVSYQEIMATNSAKVTMVRSFDAFTGQQVVTDIQVPGLEDLLTVNVESVSYTDGTKSGMIEMINRPALVDYIPYIYMQNQAKDYLHLPQLSEKFIEYLKQNRQILPETSVFIGFIQMKNFEVSLADETFDRRHIVYFNSQGEISLTPIANGGFAIFNVPVGIQEIIINDQESDKIFSQVFYSKDSMNYLAHFAE